MQEIGSCTFTYTREVYQVKWWTTWNPSRPILPAAAVCRSKIKMDSHLYVLTYFLYHCATALVVQGLLIVEDSPSHSDTPHSVGLLWMSDQPDAETCTWQHTTLTRNRYACPRRDSNPQSVKRADADPLLRPRGHWGRRVPTYTSMKSYSTIFQMGLFCRNTRSSCLPSTLLFSRCHRSASRAQLQKQLPNRTTEHLVIQAKAWCMVATIICFVMLLDQKEEMLFSKL